MNSCLKKRLEEGEGVIKNRMTDARRIKIKLNELVDDLQMHFGKLVVLVRVQDRVGRQHLARRARALNTKQTNYMLIG